MQALKLGFIGGGHMAQAMLKGLGGEFKGILVSEPSPTQSGTIRSLGHMTTESNRLLVERSEFIVLAVRPNILPEVLREVADLSDDKCFLSIAAGISVKAIRSLLPQSARVLRAMPNMNLEAGAGAVVLAQAPEVPEHIQRFAISLFSGTSTVSILPEELFSAVTGISGSSPAYFFMMADAMLQSAVAQGIPMDVARVLVAESMRGSAIMMTASGETPDELARKIAVPGGTTEAALRVLQSQGWGATLGQAILACANRSKEIEASYNT